MPQLSGPPNPIDDQRKDYLPGWIEKQEKEKVVATLKAHYRVIPSLESREILANEFYSHTTEEDFSKKAQEAVFYKAIYKDIFKSHLSLLTQSLPPAGGVVEIVIHFPNYQSEIVFIAKVISVETNNELGREVYPARLKGLSVNQESVTKLIYDINQKKIKDQSDDDDSTNLIRSIE